MNYFNRFSLNILAHILHHEVHSPPLFCCTSHHACMLHTGSGLASGLFVILLLVFARLALQMTMKQRMCKQPLGVQLSFSTQTQLDEQIEKRCWDWRGSLSSVTFRSNKVTAPLFCVLTHWKVSATLNGTELCGYFSFLSSHYLLMYTLLGGTVA